MRGRVARGVYVVCFEFWVLDYIWRMCFVQDYTQLAVVKRSMIPLYLSTCGREC